MVHLLFQMSSLTPGIGALSAMIRLLPNMIGEGNIKSLLEGETDVKPTIEGETGVRPKNG